MGIYGYESVDFGKWVRDVVIVFLCLAFIFCLLFSCSSDVSNWISDDEALVRFKQLAETDDVVIVRRSNSGVVLGDPNDVNFELRVDGKPTSGRCTSATFSEMVCRLYVGEE